MPILSSTSLGFQPNFSQISFLHDSKYWNMRKISKNLLIKIYTGRPRRKGTRGNFVWEFREIDPKFYFLLSKYLNLIISNLLLLYVSIIMSPSIYDHVSINLFIIIIYFPTYNYVSIYFQFQILLSNNTLRQQ